MEGRNETHEGRILRLTGAAALFVVLGAWVILQTPSTAVAWVVGFLLLTIYLFVFEVLPVDVAAIAIMVLLGLSALFYPYMGLSAALVPDGALFDGFKSNAVMSIIAVMIIGAGLDMTGVMGVVAKFIMRLGGSSESRIISVISSSVGVISSFMQNVGAAALFLPVIGRISSRSGIAMSRLLMPMGFCAILGGTMTLVGSSPLILLNDLIDSANMNLPADQQIARFGLFSVTPIGLTMIFVGVLYFIVLGRWVLPKSKALKTDASMSLSYYKKTYGLNFTIVEVQVPNASELVGKTLGDFETRFNVRAVAMLSQGVSKHGAGYLPLSETVEGLDILALVGDVDSIDAFIEKYDLIQAKKINRLSEIINPSQSGLSEAVVHPSSPLVGSSARDIRLRSEHGMSVLAVIRGEEVVSIGQDVRSMPFVAGDTLVFYSNWKDLNDFEDQRDMVVVTSNYPREKNRPNKVGIALFSLVVALSLVLFTSLPLSVSLLVGALGMVLGGVLNMEEAYAAVSWKTVFLLASLIPLGMAVELSGTAKWIADLTLTALDGWPAWQIQLAVAILATLFTLVMSNVGATVLLVPLAINIAIGIDANPALFALTVALATSNSFLIPTHQVNALIMGPGGYAVKDFIKAGGIMTVLFLLVLMLMLTWFY
ncbi:SLC13 family permease [Ostreibacterium oceani]|uniref:SLC13 family permease n=1 Tax=Ostreibacterium oceani TaxID=2654998 RepID=UPI00128C5314|nr:SLC13 family permease [Ostreibacterium oceani]